MIGLMVSAAVVGALLGPILGSAAAIFGTVPAFAVVSAIGAGMAVWAALEPAPGAHARGSDLRIVASRPASRHPRRSSPHRALSVPVLGHQRARPGRAAAGWAGGLRRSGPCSSSAPPSRPSSTPCSGRWSDRSGFRTPIGFGLLGSTVVRHRPGAQREPLGPRRCWSCSPPEPSTRRWYRAHRCSRGDGEGRRGAGDDLRRHELRLGRGLRCWGAAGGVRRRPGGRRRLLPLVGRPLRALVVVAEREAQEGYRRPRWPDRSHILCRFAETRSPRERSRRWPRPSISTTGRRPTDGR